MRGRQLDVAAVRAAVGDEALVGGEQRSRAAVARRPRRASSRSSHVDGTAADERRARRATRSMRRPMSPKRHAGPRTVDSFHMPDERGQVGDAVVEHVDRRGAVVEQLGRAGRIWCRAPRPAFDGRNSPTVAASARTRRSRDTSGTRRGGELVVELRRPGRGASPPRRRCGRGTGAPTAAPSAMRVRPPPGLVRGERRVGAGAGRRRRAPCGRPPRPARRPDRPEQRVGGTGRHRRDEVDLRQRRRGDHRQADDGSPTTHTSLARRAVGERGSSPGVEHPPVAARHHRHAVGAGDGVQAHDHGGVDQLGRRRNAGTVGEVGAPPGGVEALRSAAACRATPAAAAHARRQGDDPRARPSRGRWRARTPPSATATQQTGHAHAPVALDLDRVDAVVLQPAVDDVDRVEPAERAQPQPALAHHEVGRLDEVEAEQPGERRVLDVGRMRRRRR